MLYFYFPFNNIVLTEVQFKNGTRVGGFLGVLVGFPPFLPYSKGLHMESCRTEQSDAPTPANCATSRCRFSSLTDQLWYLNSHQQFSSAYTLIQGGVPPGANTNRTTAENTPMCLSAVPAPEPVKPDVPQNPPINYSLPLQVWAGPLAGGDVVVLLLNADDNATATITASWAEIGLGKGVVVSAQDLWTGESLGVLKNSAVSAKVGPHDTAVIRLTPTKSG